MVASTFAAIRISGVETLPNRVHVLLVACDEHDRFVRLPDALRYDGQLFGKTGWNSDTGFAYFRTDAALAFPVEGGSR